MRATTADGTGIWWEREGAGPAVLLVPGRGDATDLFPEDLTGRLDRMLPVAHGEALARGIAGATLDVRNTMGHIPRPQDWEAVAAAAIELAGVG